MFTRLFLALLNREASSAGRGAGRIMECLGITGGETVADIGSGGGYFTLLFARRVGESGKVYAVDVKRKYLDFVGRQAARAGLHNVECVPAERRGVELPASSVDLAFARNVFHHLPDPAGYFRRLGTALKPGGRVAIIDYMPGRGVSFASLFRHVTPVEDIRGAMEDAGYVPCGSFDFLRAQSFMIFSAAGHGGGKTSRSRER